MFPKRTLRILLAVCACISTFFAFDASAKSRQGSARTTSAATSRVPLYFEENQGQTAGEVRFLARAGGYTAFLTSNETVLHYQNGLRGEKDAREAIVRMRLAGSRKAPAIRGGERLSGVVNYLIGNDPSKWRTRIPIYADVQYDKVYPGVDLVYRPAGKQLAFDFHVAPGADPDPIRIAYSGASRMHLDTAGDLVLDTAAGPAKILKPVAYQEIDNQRVPVTANYVMLSGGEVAFKLGEYDRRHELVIDPTVGPSVYYSTYLGSGTGDNFAAIAVDPAGEAFITGSTYSDAYPTGAEPGYGPYSSVFPSNYVTNMVPVGFVTALNATGTGIIYSTYISGNSASSGSGASLNAIAVNASGNAFVGGQTDDSTFPTSKAFQATYPPSRLAAYGYGNTSGVVLELTPHGDSLVYSSFLGGGDTDSVNAIAVDGSNNAYVTGTNMVGYYYQNPPYTSAFPVTSGVVWGRYPQGNLGGGFSSAFATKIAPPSSGTATVVYSTVIGVADNGTAGTGSNMSLTYGQSIAVDGGGNAYVAGTTNCDIGASRSGIAKTLKMTNVSLGWSGCYSYLSQTWVAELDPTATSATYLAYLGGSTPGSTFSPTTTVAGIAVDSAGQAYVTGTTQANNFQTTAGAYQTVKKLAGTADSNGTIQSDGYVTVIAPGGASFAYSTYLNGSAVSPAATANYMNGSPSIRGIALGTGGQFAVSGLTTTTDFPVAGSPAGTPLLSTYPGCPGACAKSVPFVTKFTTSGLVYSTFLGAGGENTVNGIASNGTDIYTMFGAMETGLTTGGAYDSDNSTAAKELVVRVQDPPALSTTVTVDGKTANPSSSDQAVSLTSSISSSSTVNGGTVTYTVADSSSTQVGAAVTSGIVAGNVASAVAFTLPGNTPAGTYTINASYKGAQGFLNSSATGTLLVKIPKPESTTTLTASPNPSTFGASVTFTAAVSGASGTPTGEVAFYVDGAAVDSLTLNATGTATFVSSSLAGGTHVVRADYLGDATYGESSNSVTQTINHASTTATVTSSANPSTFGQAVTFTATVTPSTVTGTVTFTDNGVPLGTLQPISDGRATFMISTLTAGSHTIVATYSGDANYSGSNGTATETINPATPVITWAAPANITYGTKLSATQLNASTTTGGTWTYNPPLGTLLNATTYTLTVTFNPTDTTNYTTATTSVTLIVDKATASVTPSAASKTYGTTDPTLTGTLAGFVASDNVTAAYARTAGETVAGDPYTISATLAPAAVLGNYNITYNTANFTINKATASVTPNPASKTYGTTDPTVTGTLAGFVAGDNVTATYTRAAGETVAGGPYTISATLAPAAVLGNYNITYNTANFTIGKASASVTPNGALKTYGATDPTLTGALSGFLASDNVTAAYARTAGETVVGGPYTISATLAPTAVLGNYNIAYSTANFTISKATASVTPNGALKTYGATDPTLTGALSGFVAGDNVTATYTRTAGETVAGGPYTISATLAPAAVLGNYNITYNTANFTISKASASVTPNPASKIYGSNDPTLTGALSSFVAGDNVTATYARLPGETVAGGPYTISATLAPAAVLGNYNITYNTANFAIDKAAASATPNPASKTYGATDPTLTGTLAGFVAGDSVTAAYARTAGETVAGGPYTISATLTPAAVLGNYNITYNTANFAIDKAAASVTPNPASKTYGATDPTLTGALAGFVASDNVTAAYARTAGETVAGGPYTISATLAPAAVLGNYNITYNSANLTISKATASVTPNPASKAYGSSDPALTGALTGFVASDGVTAAYARTTGETVAGGPYTISATLAPAAALGNYNITYNTASLTISKAAASVTPNATSKTYGVSDPALTGTLAGFVTSDNVTATYTRTTGETVAGGPYTISATLAPAAALGNYDITYNTASFAIDKAAASVMPNATSKTYGTSDPALTGTLTGFVAGDNVAATYTRVPGDTVAGSPYTISATLAPTAVLGNYDVSYGTASFTITKAPTAATLQTSAPAVMLMSSVTLTAKVSSPNGTPTGTVSFMNGSASLGNGAIDNTGTATLTLSTLSAGTHNLTVVYNGDSNFSGITSAAVSQTVQDFQFAAAGGSGTVLSATVLPGGVASYQLQVTPSSGTTFFSAITLSLTGLPAGATYTITPATIAAGSGSQTITVQVQTPKVVAGMRSRGTGLPLYGLGLLLPMFGVVHLSRLGAKRKKYAALVLCLLLAVGILSMSACGGTGGFLNQAPQTYTLQLNGASGALQHSATLNLTIQ